MKHAIVLGAGGFIGSHLVKRLKSEGYWVRGVDLKYPEFSTSEADDFIIGDLRDNGFVSTVMFSPIQRDFNSGFDEVYQLAADMGGAGFVFTGENDSDIMHNSAMINLNVCYWANYNKVGKIFYSSSACMYPQEIQNDYHSVGLCESDAYPANPDSEYGWEKLFSERLFMAYARNHGLNIRIARFHNIFGVEGTYQGGREKAPAALCRKVALSDGHIEVWGSGEQTRSFLYIDECIEGVRRLMESEYKEPINIGSDELISINDLAKMIIEMSGKALDIKNIDGAVGVMGRNSDNTLIFDKLGWKPSNSLRTGIIKTYSWIKNEFKQK